MAARIEWKASVRTDLEKLEPNVARRIVRKIERELASEKHQAVALSGQYAGLYRLRVGNYRVIYMRTNTGYLVLKIAHRREAYRRGLRESG